MMWRVAEFVGLEVITYCVMSNHAHLLIRVPTVVDGVERNGFMVSDIRRRLLARMGDVSMFMCILKQRFSKWYNKKHNRFGTLWAERFKSVLLADASEALRTVAMYIDLNPVRAGLVEDPKDYRICGHAEAVAGNQSVRREVQRICEAKSWRGGRRLSIGK